MTVALAAGHLPVLYRVLAGLVVVVHLGYIAFAAVGGLAVWRSARWLWLHLPALGWAVVVSTAGFGCPLTALEKHFSRLAGGTVYGGGFVDHYLEGVVYPQRMTPWLQALAVVASLVGYARLLRAVRSPTLPA